MLLSSDGKTSLEFLSTPSARRATGKRWPQRQADCHFYPRPPRGGRHELHRENQQYKQFLSTPSARRATARKSGFPATRRISIHALREEGDAGACDARAAPYCISIHALREEGDFGISCILHSFYDFYPRPPRGGRPRYPRDKSKTKPISIHALREEGDAVPHLGAGAPVYISIHALREEGDA